ncbi:MULTISPECIES: hypothetical protein [Ramlibacter]|uniref:PilN domain-containing protein n=1 Tax=Ramlibacter aquaticus TaxID=2780094 RepID=A0ABR9SK38_9BURK|nr:MULTISPECIES: hypothetical protein [Ramlibacter]MBE7942729.1 hypothetical protein [Ramlibacter aquaticus]
MSQQINLLRQKGLPQAAVYSAAVLLGVGLVAVLGYGGMASQKLSSAQAQLASEQQQVQRLKQAIQAAEIARRAPDGIQALDDEIARLNARSQQAAPLLASIEAGAAGDPQGYSKQLGLLATIPRDELWLTNVDVGKSSKQVLVAGRAMRNEQAVAYAKRLRDAFDPLGVHFNAIELRPEPLPNSAADKPATVVNFKIS